VEQEKGVVLKMEGLDLLVQVCRNYNAVVVLEVEKNVLFFLRRIVLEEAMHIRGLEEVCHNLAVASVVRVVVHLRGILWEVEEGVSSIVEVGVDCIAGSRMRREDYCYASAVYVQ
jgi:hypothetical protein